MPVLLEKEDIFPRLVPDASNRLKQLKDEYNYDEQDVVDVIIGLHRDLLLHTTTNAFCDRIRSTGLPDTQASPIEQTDRFALELRDLVRQRKGISRTGLPKSHFKIRPGAKRLLLNVRARHRWYIEALVESLIFLTLPDPVPPKAK